MTHFAIPGDGFSPAEAELASILDDGAASIYGCAALIGLLLISIDQRLTVVLVALPSELDAESWWTR